MDWKALGIKDYPTIIKRPMDLGTVTNQPLMLRSDKDKDLYYAVAKEVAETSRHHDNYP